MSERKRVIKVDNLVIEAENVFIEPRRRHHDDDHKRDRRVDPFFGRRHKGDDNEVGGVEDRDHKRDDVRGEEDENERHHRKRGFWF